MPTSISDISIAPIGADLTLDNLKLQVLRGIEKAHRVDKKLAPGVALAAGEWGVLGSDSTVSRPTATPSAASYLCFSGTDRYDSKATGQVTLFMASPLIVKSSFFDAGENYEPGDALTVKDLGGGEAGVTKAGLSDPVLAKVVEQLDGALVYQVLA